MGYCALSHFLYGSSKIASPFRAYRSIFMKKKFTVAFFLSLACACLCTAVACKDEDSSNTDSSSDSSVVSEQYTLTLQGGEGYSFIAEGLTHNSTTDAYTVSVAENTSFTFSLDIGAFYAGTPIVSVDGVALAETDGQYTVTVSQDTTVDVSGIRKDVSSMMGSGSFDDAFVVSRPIDLVYIAEQVNKGNTRYSQGYYVLANDIDCKGETLQVIGDMRNENAYFSGCFSCLSDGSTMERFSISNFTINAEETGYAGLFGFVQTDMSITSSGLFYGIRIDNFSINVNATRFPAGNRSVYCGGLIGYGVGVKSYLCDATNGEITVTSDSNEFSFIGGLIGIAQGAYNSAYNHIALSEVAYAMVDVDINVLDGSALAGGGIAGYTLTNSLIAPSIIHNSYATGNVSGAIRSGGLVGVMGQHSSVASSYASGNVVAEARNTADTDGMNADYCIAYAGGLVGYAENDSVVNDSFSTGSLTAIAVDGEASQKTSQTTAGMDSAGKVAVNSQKHEVINCPVDIDTTALLNTLTKDLGWQTVNWNIQDKVLPTINYEPSSESVTTTITLHYVTNGKSGVEKVKVNDSETDSCSYIDSYAPYVDALNGGMLPQYLQADDKKLLSYGVFFDEACTKPVPYAYVTTRNIDLYMGFADPTPILGEYLVSVDGKTSPVTVTLNANREAIVQDGASSTTAPFYYDGNVLTIEGARLTRFFDGAINPDETVNADELFDLNRYMLYYFQAKKSTQTITLQNGSFTTDVLSLYDGIYYTVDAPIYAYKPNATLQSGAYYRIDGETEYHYEFYPDYTGIVIGGANGYTSFRYSVANGTVTLQAGTSVSSVPVADLQAYDTFRGEWKRSASINDFFSFDGKGNWSAFTRIYTRTSAQEPIVTRKVNVTEGTYTVSPDGTQLALSVAGLPYATAKFDAEGMFNVTLTDNTVLTYSKNDSVAGLWESRGNTLQLNGFNKDGLATANVHYEFQVNGYDYTADYTLTYELSETENYYCLYLDGSAFGYFYLEPYSYRLVATLLNPIGDGSYTLYVFELNHEIGGDWISSDLSDVSFNGIGAFNEHGDWVGKVKIGDEEVDYTLEKSSLSGSFHYKGSLYQLVYDAVSNKIKLTKADGTELIMERKDALANISFVDKQDNTFSVTFDGKSSLKNGGTMTVKGTQKYTYAPAENGYTITKDGENAGTLIYNEITASYTLTLNNTTYNLYVANDYMGDWAISASAPKVPRNSISLRSKNFQ